MRFITGHQQKGEPAVHDWKGLADAETTLVVYMGLANLETIAKELIKAGLSKHTPVAAIQSGTLPEERRCFSTLAKIAKDVKREAFEPPTLIIIGKVVALSPYR